MYNNMMARQFNGPIILSMLTARHNIYNEAEEFLQHRQHLSIDNATEEELALIGKFLAIPRPFAEIEGEIVYCDVDFYRLFIKNVMLLRTTKSLLNFQQMIKQFIPSGLFFIEIQPNGDIKVTIDEHYEAYEPFFQIAADTVFNSLPRIYPILSWDFSKIVYQHALMVRLARYIDPSWYFRYEYVPASEVCLKGTGSNSNYLMRHVLYANGIWVSGSSNHGIWWSEDGKSWTQADTPNATTRTVNALIYTGNLWLAGVSNRGVWWSENGKDWTQWETTPNTSSVKNSPIDSLAYYNGLYLAGGIRVYWSEDGKNWIQSTITASFVTYANGMWFAASNTAVYWSENGLDWAQCTGIDVSSATNAGTVYSVLYANSIWVMSTQKGVWWSEDGKDWTRSSDVLDVKIWVLIHTDNLWVLGCGVGANRVWWSENGKNWTAGNGYETQTSVNAIAYHEGLWVLGSYTKGIWWSENGKDWTRANTPISLQITLQINCVVYAEGIWLAGSESRGILKSLDGKNWTQIDGPISVLEIAFASNMWEIASSTGGIWHYQRLEEAYSGVVDFDPEKGYVQNHIFYLTVGEANNG